LKTSGCCTKTWGTWISWPKTCGCKVEGLVCTNWDTSVWTCDYGTVVTIGVVGIANTICIGCLGYTSLGWTSIVGCHWQTLIPDWPEYCRILPYGSSLR